MNSRLQLPRQVRSSGRGRYRVPLPPFAWYRKGSGNRKSKPRLKAFLWLVLAVAILSVCLYIFHNPILTMFGEALVYTSEPQQVDVIVVLGGGQTIRAEEAVTLFRQNYADKIFVLLPESISDNAPYRDQIYTEKKLVEMVFEHRKIPSQRIDWAKRPVFSTYEETLLIKDWMQSNNAKSALVVSGYFQSSRAQWVLDRAFKDSDIRMYVIPAPENFINANNWWKDIDGILDVQNEYIKYSYYRLRGLLGRQ